MERFPDESIDVVPHVIFLSAERIFLDRMFPSLVILPLLVIVPQVIVPEDVIVPSCDNLMAYELRVSNGFTTLTSLVKLVVVRVAVCEHPLPMLWL